MIQHLAERLRRIYIKLAHKTTLPDAPQTPRAAEVYPANPFKHRARFAGCALRRQGYIAHVPVNDLADVCPVRLAPQRHRSMIDMWERGAVWPVPVVKVVITNDRFVITKFANADIAIFLSGRQHTLPVQVLEVEDVPATAAKQELLNAGLYNAKGERVRVLVSRITL